MLCCEQDLCAAYAPGLKRASAYGRRIAQCPRSLPRGTREAGPDRSTGVFAEASRLAAVELLDEHGKPAMCYFPGDPITVAVELELKRRVELPYFLLSIAGAFGPIAAASMFHDGCRPAYIEGMYRIECTFEKLFLAPRQHFTVRFALVICAYTILAATEAVLSLFDWAVG